MIGHVTAIAHMERQMELFVQVYVSPFLFPYYVHKEIALLLLD